MKELAKQWAFNEDKVPPADAANFPEDKACVSRNGSVLSKI